MLQRGRTSASNACVCVCRSSGCPRGGAVPLRRVCASSRGCVGERGAQARVDRHGRGGDTSRRSRRVRPAGPVRGGCWRPRPQGRLALPRPGRRPRLCRRINPWPSARCCSWRARCPAAPAASGAHRAPPRPSCGGGAWRAVMRPLGEGARYARRSEPPATTATAAVPPPPRRVRVRGRLGVRAREGSFRRPARARGELSSGALSGKENDASASARSAGGCRRTACRSPPKRRGARRGPAGGAESGARPVTRLRRLDIPSQVCGRDPSARRRAPPDAAGNAGGKKRRKKTEEARPSPSPASREWGRASRGRRRALDSSAPGS